MKFNKVFFKKFFIVCGVLLLALIATLAVIYTVLNIKWGGELRSEIERLKASGVPMTIKDIAPAPLPSAENASVEYLQIFSLMTDGTFSMKNFGKSSKEMQELDTLCLSAKTMEEFEKQCTKNAVRIREILNTESFRQIFELSRKAAAKPGMNFNLSYEDGPGLLLPHLSKTREICSLMRLKAELELIEGQRDKAWESILIGLKISSHLRTEPVMISQLVYIHCSNICFDFISRNLPRYGISNEDAVKLITSLAPEKTEYTQSLKKAIDGERITCGGWVFELVLSGRLRSEDLAGLIVDMNWFSKHPKLGSLFISLYKPFAKRDYLEYLKRAERGKSEYDQKYYKLNYGDASVNLILANAQKVRDSFPKYCVFTRELIPSFWIIRLKTAKIETQAQEVRIRLALEEYKNLKGAYPDKLEPIVPQFLKEMPVSEMTGKPFEYSKENEGYKISGGIVEIK